MLIETAGALSLALLGFQSSTTVDTEALLPGPAIDANVFVYRKNAQPLLWSPTVKVDGVKMVALGNKAYTATRVAPGPHKVKLSWPLISAQSSAEMTIDVVEGKIYYLEITGTSQVSGVAYPVFYFQMGSGMAEVKPEYALEAISRCCKFKPSK